MKDNEVELLAFLWGAVFVGGLFAASQAVLFSLDWGSPPTIFDLIGTLSFVFVATLLLVPSVLVLKQIGQGTFRSFVEKVAEERLYEKEGKLRREERFR